jgi:hypothetical protein
MKVKLTKLETLEEAEFPQEDKYPSKTTVKEGFMAAEHMPQIGEAAYIQDELGRIKFHTSTVRDIEEVDNHTMILTTLNSKYRLDYERETADIAYLIKNNK